MLKKPRDRVCLPPRSFMISARVACFAALRQRADSLDVPKRLKMFPMRGAEPLRRAQPRDFVQG